MNYAWIFGSAVLTFLLNPKVNLCASWENDNEIEIFREYLRIPSVHPDINYTECVEFLKKQAADLQLPVEVYYPASRNKPVVVMTWKGQQPDLPSIMLNSHMDVVTVYEDQWTHPPFAAEMDDEGRIFARGAQDMKNIAMQYLAAIRALKKEGVTLKRTIHITFVPDEEPGGKLGMDPFVKSDDFKKLNVGFALDEGIGSNNSAYVVFYAERAMWRVHMIFTGPTGHGSILHKGTAGEKLSYVLKKLMDLRAQQVKRLSEDPNLYPGDVITINLTELKGGVESNVVPAQLTAGFDIRLPITLDFDEFEKQILKWCEEAGGDIELEYEMKEPKVPPTKLDDSNPYWLAYQRAINKLDLNITTQVCSGGTDARYVRAAGIPALGFTPMINTVFLGHNHNEFLKADDYVQGIEIYKTILPEVANF